MKTPVVQISSALNDYYSGKSINKIRAGLNSRYSNTLSTKTVYEWTTKYSNESVEQFKTYHPQVGTVWVADETLIKMGGKPYWCIDIIDRNSRFLLGTMLSQNREANDIKILLEYALEKARKMPKKILTDGWSRYRYGIELAFGANYQQIFTGPISLYGKAELIEIWHKAIEARTKTLGHLKSMQSANKFLDGFRVYYNYLRPHESLSGKTPAEKARIQYSAKSWEDVIRAAKPQFKELVEPNK
jgi:putative transposase